MKWLVSSKISLLLIGFCAALLVGAGSANADFTFGTPTNLGPPVNSSYLDASPSISLDGLSLFFHSDRPGGYSELFDIWVTTRPTKNDPWSEPVNLGPTINTSMSEWEPDISTDGLTMVFNCRWAGTVGTWDVWITTRPTTDDPWPKAVNLGTAANSSSVDGAPCISTDGLTIFFESNRSGGQGGWDVWMTTRPTTNDPWGESVNLGPIVNSSSTDAEPDISADGRTLFFSSRRSGGLGDKDIWVTRRLTTNDPWGPPVNLGPVLNSSERDGHAKISADGRSLFFASSRPGGVGGRDIWQVPIIPIVDFNGDGIVNVKDVVILTDHWGTDETLCDIGPMPMGDGIVDVRDLLVLAEYIEPEVKALAFWTLDESEGILVKDSAGENDAYVFGSPVWQPTGGKVDGALQLDGVDDYVSTPFILDPAKGSLSAFAWIKGGEPGQVIISQTDGTGVGTRWLWADPSYGRLITRLMHPPFDPLMSESVITDGQWHHIGLVYDFVGLYRYLYVDGAEVARDIDIVGGVGSDGGLYIGAGKTLDAGSFFSGLIDDVRIYNRALKP